MNDTKAIIAVAIKNVLAISVVSTAIISAATHAATNATTSPATNATTNPVTNKSTPAPDQEKCYGIVKAGMNDCETNNTACAGSSVKDNQPDAFVFVPKGLCEKIVGGSPTPKVAVVKK